MHLLQCAYFPHLLEAKGRRQRVGQGALSGGFGVSEKLSTLARPHDLVMIASSILPAIEARAIPENESIIQIYY